MQIRNNFKKNVIFIACKLCKIWQYYVYSMVISLSPIKRKTKNIFRLNIWFMLFCRNFIFLVIDAFFFCQICILKISEFTKKRFFSQSVLQSFGALESAPWGWPASQFSNHWAKKSLLLWESHGGSVLQSLLCQLLWYHNKPISKVCFYLCRQIY